MRAAPKALGAVLPSFLILAFAGSASAQAPEFSFALTPCGVEARQVAGLPARVELDLVLTSRSDSPAIPGAQAWSASITAEGLRVVSITTAGTLAAEFDDDPPGLRRDGFERSELADFGCCECAGRPGALTAVQLSFLHPIVLPVVGEFVVARLEAELDAPHTPGAVRAGVVGLHDGCRGSGGPVDNIVVQEGRSLVPSVASCELSVASIPAWFIRGDSNDDGRVDLSDARHILGCKFLGEECPSCRDAGDANDDGQIDVSDAIALLGFLFLGAIPPPAPGPYECGEDATADAVGPCVQSACDV